MTGAALSDPDSLSLLLFTAAGVSFAADLEQIAAMSCLQPAEGEVCSWFHEEFGIGPVDPAQYVAPTVLTVCSGGAPPYRLVVDAMEDIIEVPIGEIHPFPPLVAPLALEHGMWGVVPRNGFMIYLVDLERLHGLKCCAKRRNG